LLTAGVEWRGWSDVVTPSEEQVRAAVAQQAGTWFIANQSGSLEDAERTDFVAWLKASPIHVEEYLGIALIAHDLPAATDEPDLPLESLIEMARADDSNGVVSLEAPLRVRDLPRKQISKRQTWSFATSTAAVVMLLAASALWWLRDGDLPGLTKTYGTAHGEQIVAQLPDGSELHLNTDSSVTVRYSRGERLVELARGQALFTVARDDHRRFRVAAGEAQVLAVGTRFDTYRRPDATIVTVVEGSVAVLAGEPPPEVTGLPPGALRVDAGYQVHVDADGEVAQPIPVDVQQAVAWQHSKIAFERRPLGEVADEFNRYGSIPIEIDDAALRALPISGTFDAHDVDSFVAFLQTLDGVRVEKSNTRIRVLSVKPQKE
jgi:transmembrane sensor